MHMPDITPVVLSIIRCDDKYLFIRRRRPPYEGLWSLVGGKMKSGEHIRTATIREVLEETGAHHLNNYAYLGLVTECLRGPSNEIESHFLISVSYCEIDRFTPHNQEGELQLFTRDEIESMKSVFLPSDWYMFKTLLEPATYNTLYEAEIVHEAGDYRLVYFRAAIS